MVLLVLLVASCFLPFAITISPNNSSYREVNDTLFINVPESDIDDSKITLYIKLSTDDYNFLPEELSWKHTLYHRVYYTSNPEDINQILKSMTSKVMHKDVVTVGNEIIVARNDSTILYSGIVIDDECGLQNEEYGFCKFIDENRFLESISKMKPYYWPVLLVK